MSEKLQKIPVKRGILKNRKKSKLKISSPRNNRSNECCWVYGCKSSRKNTVGVKYHKFPKDDETVLITNNFGVIEKLNRKILWENNLLVGKKGTKSMKVCSLHFKEDDYTCSGWSSRKMLKPSAIPSQNLPQKQNETSTIPIFTETEIKTEPLTEEICNSQIKEELLDNEELTVKQEEIQIKEEVLEDQISSVEDNLLEYEQKTINSGKRKKKSKLVSVDVFECPNCDFITISKLIFINHLKLKHDMKDEHLLSLTDFIQKYKECNYCPFKAKSKKCVKIHECLKHFSQTKPFYCANCNYKTNKKYNLISHVKIHNSVKFKCLKCDFLTSNLGFFTKHQKHKHPTEMYNIYKCSKCDFKSRNPQSLNEHLKNKFECESMQIKTFTKRFISFNRYKCLFCDFRSESLQTLISHSIVKHGLNKESSTYKEMFSESQFFSI